MSQYLTRRTFNGLGLGAAGLFLGGGAGASMQAVAQEATPATPEPGPAIPPEVTQYADDWPVWQGGLGANRVATTQIAADTLENLEIAWRFPLTSAASYGAIVAPPLIIGETVYIQDTESNVFALDRSTGEVKWETDFDISTPGPNGLAVGYGLLFGPTGPGGEGFALRVDTGELVWKTKMTLHSAESVYGAPGVYDNVVYFGKVSGYSPGSRSGLYALDVQTGEILWSFDTTTDNLWENAALNSGAGIWYPPSFDDEGNIYIGTGNAAPFSGTDEYPNGSSRPGDNLYSSSMVSLDPTTGAIRWYYQDRYHDILDHDFMITPLIVKDTIQGDERTFAVGSGKTGNIAAVDTETGQLIWKIPVGAHNAYGDGKALPDELVKVLPGTYGGVETGPAYRDGILYVPVVSMSTTFCSTCGLQEMEWDLNSGTGHLMAIDVATAQIQWQVDLPQLPFAAVTLANDVVFVPLMNGTFNAHSIEDGSLQWSYQVGAGFNAPPAIAGDIAIIGAGGPLLGDAPEDVERGAELIAFRLSSEGEETPSPAEAATPSPENVASPPA